MPATYGQTRSEGLATAGTAREAHRMTTHEPMSSTEVRQTESRLELVRAINALPSAVFAVISDPTGHVSIDGSGMLVAAQNSSPLTGVGDSFVMDMDREALGDVPL